MVTLETAENGAYDALGLSVGTVIDDEPLPYDYSTIDTSGIYRAIKSRQLLEQCVTRISCGGVVALVPSTASNSYLAAVTEQVEQFTHRRGSPGADGRDGILVLPTSGSTGTPKLVALPAHGLAQFLQWGRNHFGFASSTVSLSLSPWNFDVSLLDTWAVLAAGGTVVAASSNRLHDAAYLSQLMEDQQPTFIQVVPATLTALVNACGEQDFAGVRDLVLTGGAASRSTRMAAAQCFPNATFHNLYGATEVNDCLIQPLSREQFSHAEFLPLGSPITGCEVRLRTRDREFLIPEVPPDTDGELLVRTPWMALGYISDGEIASLQTTDSRLYAMQDQATWSAGQLIYRGRRDRTIKLRGQRVNLDEIEQAARRTGLVGMALAWVDDAPRDQELRLAYTASDPRRAPAPGLTLRVALSSALPSFAMPNHLHPFSSPFPLNGNGKPDAARIKSQSESG